MHEVSLMKNVLDLALLEMTRAGAGRIGLVRVRAGVLAGVVPEAMEFAFDVLRRENAATAEARLAIDSVSACCRCRDCGFEFEPTDAVFECPGCRGLNAIILRGRELELSQLEVI